MTLITVTNGPMSYIKQTLPESMSEEKAQIAAMEIAEGVKWNKKVIGKEKVVRVWGLVAEFKVEGDGNAE